MTLPTWVLFARPFRLRMATRATRRDAPMLGKDFLRRALLRLGSMVFELRLIVVVRRVTEQRGPPPAEVRGLWVLHFGRRAVPMSPDRHDQSCSAATTYGVPSPKPGVQFRSHPEFGCRDVDADTAPRRVAFPVAMWRTPNALGPIPLGSATATTLRTMEPRPPGQLAGRNRPRVVPRATRPASFPLWHPIRGRFPGPLRRRRSS